MTQPPSHNQGQTCPVCGFKNRSGVLVCDNCGTQLVSSGRSVIDTRNLTNTGDSSSGTSSLNPPAAPMERPADPPPAAPPVVPFTPAPPSPVPNDPAPSTALTQKCPHCGHVNRVGVLICDNCGTNLATGEQPRVGTATFNDGSRSPIDAAVSEAPEAPDRSTAILNTDEVRAVQTAGAAVFEDDMILRIEVEGAPTPILVYPTAETIMGRRDPVTGAQPDVDLTAFAGYRMGVSRQHATLRLRSKVLDIRDLGSSNGTYVNGVRLMPHQPHSLRDGDEVSLGKMAMKIFFQANIKR